MKSKNTRPLDIYDDMYPYDDDMAVSSARECTGMIPSKPISAAELEAYNDIHTIGAKNPDKPDKSFKKPY